MMKLLFRHLANCFAEIGELVIMLLADLMSIRKHRYIYDNNI